MIRFLQAGVAAFALLAGCASYDGRTLVAGQSTTADVEALMGPPAEKVARTDGGNALYYPRGPSGRHTYVVTVDAKGTVLGVDQRLTAANAMKLMTGTTTAREVRELFGPPGTVSHYARQDREVWEYKWKDVEDKRVFWMQFSSDGILREAINSHDFDSDPPGGPAGSMP